MASSPHRGVITTLLVMIIATVVAASQGIFFRASREVRLDNSNDVRSALLRYVEQYNVLRALMNRLLASVNLRAF